MEFNPVNGKLTMDAVHPSLTFPLRAQPAAQTQTQFYHHNTQTYVYLHRIQRLKRTRHQGDADLLTVRWHLPIPL